MIKAVIISQQGSGTNLLRSLLNSHPDIVFEAEHFCQNREFNKWKDSGKCIPDFLNDFYNSHPDKKVVGFDLKYNQIEIEILKYIEKHRIRIIHLLRDPARTALRMLNEKNKTITYEAVKEHCAYINKQQKKIKDFIEKFNNDAMEITYEEITGGYEITEFHDYETKNHILDFLCVKYYHLHISDKYINKPLKIRF